MSSCASYDMLLQETATIPDLKHPVHFCAHTYLHRNDCTHMHMHSRVGIMEGHMYIDLCVAMIAFMCV
jgi:hypothetical protein